MASLISPQEWITFGGSAFRIRKRVTALTFARFVAAGIWNVARRAASSQAEDSRELVVVRWIDDFRQLMGLPAQNTVPVEPLMGEVCLPEELPDRDAPPETLPVRNEQSVESGS